MIKTCDAYFRAVRNIKEVPKYISMNECFAPKMNNEE